MNTVLRYHWREANNVKFFKGVRIEICDGMIAFRATNGDRNPQGLETMEQIAAEIKSKKILAELHTGKYQGTRRIDSIIIKTQAERRIDENDANSSALNERRCVTPVSGLPRIGTMILHS